MLKTVFLIIVSATLMAACAQEGDALSVAQSEGASNATAGDIDALVAAADPKKGRRMYIYCQACHSLNAGGANKLGPNLNAIVGKPAAQVDGFRYSPALTAAEITWTAAALDEWIARPTALVPGTTMVFAGVADPQQRAELIAFLQQAAVAD